jgi:predicted GNAT family acetyltransferase
MADSPSAQVRRNPAQQQFDLLVDGEGAGLVSYCERGDGVLELLHTEVHPQFEGRGLGGQLVRGVLAEARQAGQKIVPSCSFIASWLERHPAEADIVAG